MLVYDEIHVGKSKSRFITFPIRQLNKRRAKQFGMTSLVKRRDNIDLIFLFKILHSKIDCPQLLCQFNLNLPCKYPRHTIKMLRPPFRKTVSGSNSPVPRLCKILNNCDETIDITCTSLQNFKNQVHKIM